MHRFIALCAALGLAVGLDLDDFNDLCPSDNGVTVVTENVNGKLEIEDGCILLQDANLIGDVHIGEKGGFFTAGSAGVYGSVIMKDVRDGAIALTASNAVGPFEVMVENVKYLAMEVENQPWGSQPDQGGCKLSFKKVKYGLVLDNDLLGTLGPPPSPADLAAKAPCDVTFDDFTGIVLLGYMHIDQATFKESNGASINLMYFALKDKLTVKDSKLVSFLGPMGLYLAPVAATSADASIVVEEVKLAEEGEPDDHIWIDGYYFSDALFVMKEITIKKVRSKFKENIRSVQVEAPMARRLLIEEVKSHDGGAVKIEVFDVNVDGAWTEVVELKENRGAVQFHVADDLPELKCDKNVNGVVIAPATWSLIESRDCSDRIDGTPLFIGRAGLPGGSTTSALTPSGPSPDAEALHEELAAELARVGKGFISWRRE